MDIVSKLPERPLLKQFLDDCCKERLYFLSIPKCGKVNCAKYPGWMKMIFVDWNTFLIQYRVNPIPAGAGQNCPASSFFLHCGKTVNPFALFFCDFSWHLVLHISRVFGGISVHFFCWRQHLLVTDDNFQFSNCYNFWTAYPFEMNDHSLECYDIVLYEFPWFRQQSRVCLLTSAFFEQILEFHMYFGTSDKLGWLSFHKFKHNYPSPHFIWWIGTWQ